MVLLLSMEATLSVATRDGRRSRAVTRSRARLAQGNLSTLCSVLLGTMPSCDVESASYDDVKGSWVPALVSHTDTHIHI